MRMPALIQDGDRLDAFRKLFRLAWEQLSEMFDEMVERGIDPEHLSNADGAMKDVLMGLEMEWYNPMDNYLWKDEILNYDPEFARGDNSRWVRREE